MTDRERSQSRVSTKINISAPRLPLPGAALPNPLLQNLMLPNLIPNIASNLNLLQTNPAIPNLLGGAIANFPPPAPPVGGGGGVGPTGKGGPLDPNKNPLMANG